MIRPGTLRKKGELFLLVLVGIMLRLWMRADVLVIVWPRIAVGPEGLLIRRSRVRDPPGSFQRLHAFYDRFESRRLAKRVEVWVVHQPILVPVAFIDCVLKRRQRLLGASQYGVGAGNVV